MTASVEPGILPFYEQPPVTEVACSVMFNSIEEFLTPHVGLLWQRFQPDYPFCDDVAPIAPKIEVFGNKSVEAKLQLSDIPPLPRIWFISPDGTRIIQLQRDRLIHNWRKVSSDSEYPRYDSLIEAFQEQLASFDSFLKEADLGQVQPSQYELTYVNQIPQGDGWTTLEDIGKIFPDFAWRVNSQRFLSKPESISWTTTFELPDEIGRLHTTIRHALGESYTILLFELTVRGIGSYASRESMQDWFDLAHEWIVQAFTDLTGEEIQKDIWKRRR